MHVLRPVVLFLLLSCCVVPLGTAQSPSSSAGARQVVRKTLPTYPEIARRMNLTGTVKVLATVSADGTVKDVQPVGGSPVLIQAAEEAVRKWKFAPATAESKELLELRFEAP